MKKKETIAIIGAGIAGITAAWLEAQKGNLVYLVEIGPKAGGLLRSETNEYGSFDYGTHTGTKVGVEALDEFLFGGMTEENFFFFNPGESGNYFEGHLSDKSPFVNITSLNDKIGNKVELELLRIRNGKQPENLEELMIQRYGITLYESVFRPIIQKFMDHDPTKLSTEVFRFFDMFRVLAFDLEVSDRLKSIPCYDDILGFHYASPGNQKIYPKSGGIGYWVTFLMEKLERAGVIFRPNTRIKNVTHSNKTITEIVTDQETLSIDKLIWTVPSAFFAHMVYPNDVFKKPIFRSTGLYDFAFEKPLDTKCYYINVHDPDLHSGRITIYQNLSSNNKYYSCTIEVLSSDDFDFEGATNKILKELYTMGLTNEDNPCVFKAYRPVRNGFPIIDLDYENAANTLLEKLNASFDNVTFLGRGNGNFFMSDVLKHAYKQLNCDLVTKD